MQAIRTRYHGATNSRGSRISAQCEAGKVFVPFDHDLDLEGNHVAAATALRVKLGWQEKDGYQPMEVGFFAGDGYHVFRTKG